MRMLASSGASGGWDAARQLAAHVANDGTPEDNPDPLLRIRLEGLVRAAELRVIDATGLSPSTTGRPVSIVPVTRIEWTRRTLDAYQPLLEHLSASLTRSLTETPPPDPDLAGADPTGALLGGMLSAMAPMLLSMQAGSMVGHLATTAFGQYGLPIPRPVNDELVMVESNVARFEEEWSVPGDDLRLWTCLSELTTHAVLGLPHVRGRLSDLLTEHADAYQLDADAIGGKFDALELSDPAALQSALGDPAALFASLQSPRQRALRPQLDALVAAVVGYVDHVVDITGQPLMGSYPMLTEALRRRRVEASPADRAVEALLGLELGTAAYERGQVFIEGVVERGGEAALGRLWSSARVLPTPAEVDAPGLWLARIDLDN